MKVSLAKINYALYTLLLIVTPFLMLQNFLQNAIGRASRSGLEISDGVRVPYTLILVGIALIVLFILKIRKMNKIRWISLGLVILLFAVGQMTTDYYFGHHFYDLQHNWHYFAYGIFAFLAFQRFSIKSRPVQYIQWIIFVNAFIVSVFDEVIQIYISNRIFDISDVAKDLWGTMIGQVVLFFLIREGRDMGKLVFRQDKLRAYFTHPFSVLCLQFIFAYCLLFFGSLLTESKFVAQVFLFVIPVFFVILLLFAAGKKPVLKWLIIAVLVLITGYNVGNILFGTPTLRYAGKNLFYYKNVPLPYFDFMIYPNGRLRAVDKKETFVLRDKQKIDDLDPDILLVATGTDGQGGKGWDDQQVTEFYYNNKYKCAYQIIKQKNREAFATYNRLVKGGKRVLVIVHNN